jgi:hypothetical protein
VVYKGELFDLVVAHLPRDINVNVKLFVDKGKERRPGTGTEVYSNPSILFANQSVLGTRVARRALIFHFARCGTRVTFYVTWHRHKESGRPAKAKAKDH